VDEYVFMILGFSHALEPIRKVSSACWKVTIGLVPVSVVHIANCKSYSRSQHFSDRL